MDYLYFPGCTLYTKAKNFDLTARDCSRLLGFELKELKTWTCCGATFPLATDNIMALLPPARILANAREEGTTLTTLCAVCFNVIKRTNRLIQRDGEKRDKINNFMEKNYQGDLRILHYLEILKKEIGFSQLKEKVKKPLSGLKAAAYYGCMLLRPFDVHLIVKRKAHVIARRTELLDLLIAARFLRPKVITREAQHLETFGLVLLIERFQPAVLGRKPALGGHVHHQ